MPRLLLVDDNPSIHRIAESLLAPTAIELVCVDSAAEALERFQNGERFDVAMIDTAMPGMDGWTLLERLRALEATARMPIAMMAGVLDPVDPVKIQNAPIQGFLKKPIELRELGDRVNTLLATPVGPSGPAAPVEFPPTATRPMSPSDLAQAVEEFPEFRPTIQLPEDDLLVLGPEDLWMEESPRAEVAPLEPAPALPDLELEELDLDAFQDLGSPAPRPTPDLPVPMEAPTEAVAAAVPENAPTLDGPSLPELDTLGAEELSGLLVEDLPELPTPQPDPFHSMAPDSEPVRLGAPDPDLEPEPEPVWGFPAEDIPAPGPWEAPAAVAPEPVVAVEPEPLPEPEPVMAPAMTSAPSGASPTDANALVQAILANPEALEALAQALAGRLSEKALREVAWEVIPDLAKKLHS